MKKKYEPVFVHGVCLGVGTTVHGGGFITSKIICNTLMKTGDDNNKDMETSLKNAELICKALNSYQGK